MIRKFRNIIVGWGKKLGLVSVSTAEEKLSELRMSKCKKCRYSSESKTLKLLNGHARYEDVVYCKKCSCPCKPKTLVTDESCPINQW